MALPRVPLRRIVRAVALAAAFAVVVGGGTAFQRAFVTPADYVLEIVSEDASGLYPGSDVMIAGAKAGSVRDVSLNGAGLAVITAGVDPAFAPVHRDASVTIRPKSLLGEMYVSLDPGRSGGTLPSGATLPRLQANRSTDLEQVVGTFDAPTRRKLQTVIVELGGGVAGRGPEVNQALPSGRRDLEDLAAVADTLAQHDQDLKVVIQDLDSVLGELARSDRREELGALIGNTQQLLANLVAQEARTKRALGTANTALGKLQTGLAGTGPNLSDIAGALPTTVEEGDLLLNEMGGDSDALLPNMDSLIRGIQYGPVVFGGRDANGYATRISLVAGCSSLDVCSQLAGPLGQLPVMRDVPGVGTPVGGSAALAGTTGATTPAGTTDSDLLGDHGLVGFLLGGQW